MNDVEARTKYEVRLVCDVSIVQPCHTVWFSGWKAQPNGDIVVSGVDRELAEMVYCKTQFVEHERTRPAPGNPHAHSPWQQGCQGGWRGAL